ncbi:MAG: tetratricopeptide repeat protein [Elusimicrobia bacterium]|nr:tetratricopeptide repeat protein [Elusimicrobiota bacterium]
MAHKHKTKPPPQKPSAAAVPAAPANAAFPSWRANVAALAVILAVALAAFWPVLKAGFISWDDPQYITQNSIVTGPHWKEVFTTSPLGYYHPLTVLVYKIEYALAGPKPAVFHAVNLALHLANCALVYYFALALRCGALPALLAALLFAVHPTRAEPVAWVSGMKDLLCCLFFMGTLLTYLRYLKKAVGGAAAGWSWLAASAALFTAALMAKPTILAGALALFLLDWHEGRAWSRKSILEKLPYFLAGAAMVLLSRKLGNFLVEPRAGFHPLAVLSLCGHGALFYLGKMFFPVNLAVLYPLIEPPKNAVLAQLPYLAMAAAVIFLFAARLRAYAFGAAFFALTLLPGLPFTGIFPADRYLYIPAIGLFYAAGAAFSALRERAKRPAAAIAAALVIALAWNCHARVKLWGSSIDLWSDAVATYQHKPQKNNGFFALVYSKLAHARAELGFYEQAIADYTKALEIAPEAGDTTAGIYWRRGETRFVLKQYAPALEDYNSSLRLLPGQPGVYVRRGMTLFELARYEAAAADLSTALKLAPASVDRLKAYYWLGNCGFRLNRYEQAARDFGKAAELSPDSALIRNNHGAALLSLGRYDEAEAEFSAAVQLSPQFADAYLNRGRVRFIAKRYGPAIEDFSKAAALAPNSAVARDSLASAEKLQKRR